MYKRQPEEGISNVGQDFYDGEKKNYEDIAAAFIVRYGHQNQNFFKDIKLSQEEYGETAEHLQLVDTIANKFHETNRAFIGQNLFNTYSFRGYNTEVEMMGDAMIQPMMYFQLNNIPMFHGAYLITKVKHSIKPNHMTTVFNGTRIRLPKTDIIDVQALYTGLLEGYNLPAADAKAKLTNNTISDKGVFPPIVITIKSNGSTNGSIDGIQKGNITMSPIKLPSGIRSNINNKDDAKLITEAIEPLNKMLTDWVDWMKSKGFVGNKDGGAIYYAAINSAFRTLSEQQGIKSQYNSSKLSATPGRSNHGWGIAIDFQFLEKNGNVIRNFITVKDGDKVKDVANPEGFKLSVNESARWLLDYSYQYGFLIPEGLRGNEFWHFEYHGRAAVGILGSKLDIYGETFTINKPLLDIVQNPKNPDGTVPTYTDFTYKHYGPDGTNVVYGGRKIILSTFPTTNMTVTYRNAVNSVGSQLGISTGIRQLMEAQAYQEGFNNSSWYGFICNNPGALETHPELNDTSCSAKKRYASFKDLPTGIAAAYNRVYKLILDNKNANYPQGPNIGLFDFVKKYAPPSENDDTEYTNMIISYFHLVFKNDTITDKTTLAEINNIK